MENTMGDDKVSLRRYEDDLNVGGLGVVALGAWDALKFIMHTIIAAKDEINLEEFAQDERPGLMGVMIVVMVLLLLVVLLIFKLHLYIGLNASKAARGEPYKKGYYKGAVILLVLLTLSMPVYVNELRTLDFTDTTMASFIVDLTTVYVLWTVVSSTRKIRKIHTGE